MRAPPTTTRLCAVAAALLCLGSAPALGCSTDTDCSLNGLCQSGACVCDKPWAGAACNFLTFKPAHKTACGPACAYHGDTATTTTSWGGSMMAIGSKYWIAVAEMADNCTLGQWTTNSQVAMAVADTPLGPYVKQSVAVQPWSHNPEMIHTQDGMYLIYTLGDGVPGPRGPPKDCRKGRSHPADTPWAGLPARTTDSVAEFVIHAATSPEGPWTAHHTNISNFRAGWSMDNWNPAPVVMPNGKIRLMVHLNVAPWAGEAIIEADHWTGPYKAITGDVTSCDHCNEDPFMWRDTRGNWHALYHRMFDPPGKSPVPSPGWSGGHVFSSDGVTWSNFSNYAALSRSYNTSIVMDDGSVFETERRERPKLLFNAQGQPTHLSNGVITSDYGTYTAIVELDV